MAVQSRRSDLVELLVKAGADINERDEGGATPLFYAVGTEIPGETGAQNRRLREALIRLGAVE